MGKSPLFSFVALLLLTPWADAQGLTFKNQRISYGPLGVTRTDTKFQPGDYLFMSFEVEGLTIDPKTNKAQYQTLLELYNSANKKVYDKKTDNTVAPMLGGSTIPGELHVLMGADQPAGKYVLRMIVMDKLAKGEASVKYFDQRFELLPADFGMVGIMAPAVGFQGQHYVANFVLVNAKLDAKDLPNVDVIMRVLDETGKKETTPPMKTTLPKGLPPGLNLAKENFIPMQFPIFLNRPGSYVIEIEAIDRARARQTKMSYTLTVIDINKFVGR